jgi:cobalt-zinc-cadmium efflux system outer membrane protein
MIPFYLSTLPLAALLICSTLLGQMEAIAAVIVDGPLELPALIEEALAQNPALHAARKQWEATREQIEQATVLPDPTFGVQLWNFPQNGNLATSPGRTQNTIYTLAQRFPFPGKLPLKGEVADRAAAISEQTLRLQERELIGRVKHTYVELFFTHKDLEIHHEHVDVLKQLFDTAKSRFRASGALESVSAFAGTRPTASCGGGEIEHVAESGPARIVWHTP